MLGYSALLSPLQYSEPRPSCANILGPIPHAPTFGDWVFSDIAPPPIGDWVFNDIAPPQGPAHIYNSAPSPLVFKSEFPAPSNISVPPLVSQESKPFP